MPYTSKVPTSCRHDSRSCDDVGPGYVDVVEQNATPSGTDRFPLHGTLMTAAGYTPIIGWVRNTVQVPVRLQANNVAGVPQTVADRYGDLDVVWRGTDGRLWTIGYRSNRWAAQARVISPANVASDPSLVSVAAGTIDAFYEGVDGHLWHLAYQAGFYGSGTWGAAASLGQGPLQSAPHAASPGDGSIGVFWKGAGGSLGAYHYGGSAYTGLGLGAVTLGGDPYPVVVGSGSTDVFWRDGSGALWMMGLRPWGSGPPQQLGSGVLASDPTPVSAGDGNVDVFWRGSDSQLWHLGVAGGVTGPAQAVAAQLMLGRPTAVEAAPGTITLVLQRSDSNLATVLDLPGIGWVGPELLGDGPVGSDPSASAFAGQAVGVFWRGQDGALWTSAACPGCEPPPPPVVAPL